ncbi:hypothetical protein F4810DRAFT_385371 [Camillea tinctor]|nr:hypothetical protein F4810DRAFT_385371 [Camillea tinctor]
MAQHCLANSAELGNLSSFGMFGQLHGVIFQAPNLCVILFAFGVVVTGKRVLSIFLLYAVIVNKVGTSAFLSARKVTMLKGMPTRLCKSLTQKYIALYVRLCYATHEYPGYIEVLPTFLKGHYGPSECI